MTVYYVSNAGDDTAAGTSPSTPWATAARAMTTLLRDGDQVLFRRNDTFIGSLNIQRYTPWKLGNARLLIGAYGSGRKPKISGYKSIPLASWVQHVDPDPAKARANVWKVAINDAGKVGGYNTLVGLAGANIGFLKVDRAIKGQKRTLLDLAVNDWDFYSDGADWLYVCSATNPGSRATSIAAAPATNGISGGGGRSGINFASLDILGFGGHGFGFSKNTDLSIAGCTIREIGGCFGGNGTTRFGNGIEFYGPGGARVNVVGNLIQDVFDVAFTMQGKPILLATDGWEDIAVRGNRVVRCSQFFETWAQYGDALNAGPIPAGAGFRRVAVEDNEVVDCGYGWGSQVRPGTASHAPLLNYAMEAPVNDIAFRRNRFHGFPGALIYTADGFPLIAPGTTIEDNTVVFDNPDQPIHHQLPYKPADWNAFQTATGAGQGCAPLVGSKATATAGVAEAINVLSAATGSLASGNQAGFGAASAAAGSALQAEHVADVASRTAATSFETLSVNVANANTWAPLLTVNLTNQVARFDAVLNYMTCGDQTANRGGVGRLNLQFVANASLTGLASCGVDLLPDLYFLTLTNASFAVVVNGDGTTVTVQLFVNIGLDDFLKMQFGPTRVSVTSDQYVSYAFLDRATLLTSLPAGSVTYSSLTNFAPALRPLQGSGAPTMIPTRIGQVYNDLTNKRTYTAYGNGFVTDWVQTAGSTASLPVSYTTGNTTAMDATLWAPVLTVTITNASARYDGLLAYMTGADSDANAGGAGYLRLQFDPNPGLTGLTNCSLDIIPLLPFRTLNSASFVAVVTGDGTTVTVQVLVNIGLDAYARMRVTPSISFPSASQTVATFIDGGVPAALPGGTATYSSTRNAITSGLTFTQTADKAVTNTASATSLLGTGNGSPTIPANAAAAGRTFRLRLSGTIGTAATPGNLTLALKLGTTTIAAATLAALPASASGAGWQAEFDVTFRSAGSAATVIATGAVAHDSGTGRGGASLNPGGNTATVDTTAALAFDVQATWSTANAGNTITSKNATLVALN